MSELKSKIEEAVGFIRKKTSSKPGIAIVLGTGLGGLSDQIKSRTVIPYDAIPHFPRATVMSHKNEMIFGKMGGKDIVALGGRFHLYEGYAPEKITFPVRVAKALGAKILMVSNAAGGMNPNYNRGDLMIINDHINFTGVNPLAGPNDESLGPRFPDMCEPYDAELTALAEKCALSMGIKAHKGVYVGVIGPSLETRAEYRFFRAAGADCVGMSTVAEVIVAVHAGLRVLGISIVTDLCLPDALRPVDIKEIIRVAEEAEPKLARVVAEVVKRI